MYRWVVVSIPDALMRQDAVLKKIPSWRKRNPGTLSDVIWSIHETVKGRTT